MFRLLSTFLDVCVVTCFSPFCPICLKEIKWGVENPCCEPVHFIESPVCLSCGSQTQDDNNICGKCFNAEPQLIDQIRSLLWYGESAKVLIHMVKYQGRFEWFNAFFECLNAQSFPFNTGGFHLLPVPIHRNKFLKRGFNQSEILAQYISNLTSVPISTGLKKLRETTPQSALNHEERKSNLQDVFVWDFKKPIPEKIILIDDIYTTGETLKACAKVLRALGVKELLAWTLFRTPQK